MTNPDNVGGLPELPEDSLRVSRGSCESVYYTPQQMHEMYHQGWSDALAELCRAAPAGGESWRTPCRSPHCANAGTDHDYCTPVSAPAGSGEVDGWKKWPIINRLQMQANDCEDAADENSDAIITALQLKAMASDLREAAALLRKLQQPAEEDAYVIEQMGRLLAEIAIIVNGPEPALTKWSYHDLPEKVRKLQQGEE